MKAKCVIVLSLLVLYPSLTYGAGAKPIFISRNYKTLPKENVANSVNYEEKEMKRVFYSEQDHHWLALNIYHEARGESLHGQMAVAFVTLNRVHHRRFPDTVEGVIKQEDQFSWYWDGLDDKPKNPGQWENCKYTAMLCLEIYNKGALLDNNNTKVDWITNGALFYFNPYKIDEPYWIEAENMVCTTEIGNHRFFKL